MSAIMFSQAGGLANSCFGKSQEPIRAILYHNVEAFQSQSLLRHVYGMDTATQFAQKYTSMTSLGDFVNVGENGARPVTGAREGYSKVIEPATWKNSFEVTRELAEDGALGSIRRLAGGFTLSYNRTREKFGAALLAGGTAKTTKIDGVEYDTACADGRPLFDAAHPSCGRSTGKQSNLFKAAFSPDALDRVQEKMQDFKDDDGNLLSISPDTILIPNSAALKRQVIAAVGSPLDPVTANNALNFQQGLWNILIWPYLPKTIGGKPYFILMDSQFKASADCLPWVDRVPLTVHSFVDNNTDANIWAGRARFGAGFNNWRCIALVGEGLENGTPLPAGG